MKFEKVKITDELSNYIERLYYEYNTRLNILNFLFSKNNIDLNNELIADYLKETTIKGVELETAKEQASHDYRNQDPEKKYSSYEFNFFDGEIIFYYE